MTKKKEVRFKKNCSTCKHSEVDTDTDLICNELSKKLNVIHPDSGYSLLYIPETDDCGCFTVDKSFCCNMWKINKL